MFVHHEQLNIQGHVVEVNLKFHPSKDYETTTEDLN